MRTEPTFSQLEAPAFAFCTAARRQPGERGAQLRPAQQLLRMRYSPEVIEHIKRGPFWLANPHERRAQAVGGEALGMNAPGCCALTPVGAMTP